MVDTLTKMPASIFAGDRLAFEKDFADYAASAYDVTYYLVANGRKFSMTGTADGDSHTFEMVPTATAAIPAGRYAFHARAVSKTDADDVATIAAGWVVVLPDPSVATSDMRSHARKVVDACNAIIEGRAEKNQVDLINYSLGVVNASRNIDQVIALRDRYLPTVKREDGNGADTRHIKVRFSDA